MISQGLLFSIATARSMATVRECIGDFQFPLPVITLNGGVIYDYLTDEKLVVVDIEKPTLDRLLAFLMEKEIDFLATCIEDKTKRDFCFFPKDHNKILGEFYKQRIKMGDSRVVSLENMNEISNYQVISITLCSERKKFQAVSGPLNENFSNQLHFYPMTYRYEDWQWCTIQSKKVSKGYGIKEIGKRKNLPLDELVVFGDNINDMSMFETGLGMATENAIDEIKSCAGEVIGHHDDDSVVRWLQTSLKNILS